MTTTSKKDANIFSRKWQGFKYIVFGDRGSRLVTVLALVDIVMLQLIRFVHEYLDPRVIYWLGVSSLSLFSYFLFFFVFFNLAVLFGAFRKTRSRQKNRNAMVWLFFTTVLALLFTYYVLYARLQVFNWRVPLFFVMFFCFVAWGTIESVFYVQMSYEVSDFTTHRLVRLLVYILLCAAYGLYAYFMWDSARQGAPKTPSELFQVQENANLFDVVMMVVLFYFGFSSMGERFLPKTGYERIRFDRLTWKEEVKLRDSVLVVFFLAIGDLIFLRGFSFFFKESESGYPLVGDEGYYLVKLVTLLVAAAVVFLAVVFRHPGPGKGR
ncbi:MAG: hypothetical protein ACTSU5_20320 [Promethearchaeota archaeon]